MPGYVEKSYGIFHREGDEAVLDDIAEFMEKKGLKINEWFRNCKKNSSIRQFLVDNVIDIVILKVLKWSSGIIELLYHLNAVFAVEGNMIETTPTVRE